MTTAVPLILRFVENFEISREAAVVEQEAYRLAGRKAGRPPLSSKKLTALLGGREGYRIGTVGRFEPGEKGPTDLRIVNVNDHDLSLAP